MDSLYSDYCCGNKYTDAVVNYELLFFFYGLNDFLDFVISCVPLVLKFIHFSMMIDDYI